jgi:flagellar basal-body rod protein FlgF
MQSALYVGLSAQVTMQRRLETIANNVANANTAGFRADAVKFESLLSRTAAHSTAFATAGENYINRSAGGVTRTDSPLDLAVIGTGWLAFSTPAGVVYTRDGRMQINADGELQTTTGRPILDANGAPIVVDPNGGPITVLADGTITQDDNQMGAIGLFEIPPEAKLTRHDNSGVIPDRPAQPVLDFVNSGVRQGYVEGSNVNPVVEMTKLIMATRMFESASSLIDSSESTLQNAVRTLGEPTRT